MQTEISLQKLFIVTCILKITSSGIGWYIGSPWLFGLWVPIAFMLAYIVIGYYKREKVVSEEKFADSCYYLGFIFTVASIIFALFDLKNIGTGLADVGIRFGAAMVSTCLGVAVRVALVNFRPNTDDALLNVEDSVINASRRLTDEFSRSFDELVDFRSKVMTASIEAVKSVELQIEAMSTQHQQKIEIFFTEMTKHNKEMTQASMQELGSTAKGLVQILNEYKSKAKNTAGSIDQTVRNFTNVMVERLNLVEFPQDIFSRRLEAPIANLNDSTNNVVNNVKQVSTNVKDAAQSVLTTVEKINAKAENLNETLSAVQNLISAQKELMAVMKSHQQYTLEQMAGYHTTLLEAVSTQQNKMTEELRAHLTAVGGVNETMGIIANNLADYKESIEQFKQASHDVSLLATTNAKSIRAVVSDIDAHQQSTNGVTEQLVKVDETMGSIATLLAELVELNKEHLDTSGARKGWREMFKSTARST